MDFRFCAIWIDFHTSIYVSFSSSGVARLGPTGACALPSIFQALPSPAQQESGDSTYNELDKRANASLVLQC